MQQTLEQLQLIELWVKIVGGILTALLALTGFLIRHFYKRLKPWFLTMFAGVAASKIEATAAASSSALAATRSALTGQGLEKAQTQIAELEDQVAAADRRFEGAIAAMDRMAGRHDSLLGAFLRQETANRLIPDLKMRVELITEYLGEIEKERTPARPRTGPTPVPTTEEPTVDDK